VLLFLSQNLQTSTSKQDDGVGQIFRQKHHEWIELKHEALPRAEITSGFQPAKRYRTLVPLVNLSCGITITRMQHNNNKSLDQMHSLNTIHSPSVNTQTMR
jgi:hypothetical protein